MTLLVIRGRCIPSAHPCTFCHPTDLPALPQPPTLSTLHAQMERPTRVRPVFPPSVAPHSPAWLRGSCHPGPCLPVWPLSSTPLSRVHLFPLETLFSLLTNSFSPFTVFAHTFRIPVRPAELWIIAVLCAPGSLYVPGSNTHRRRCDGLPIWMVRRDMTSFRVLSPARSPRQYTGY